MRKIFTPRFLFIGLFFLMSAAASYGQVKPETIQKVGPTIAVTGHLIRTTPKLADIDGNSMYGQPLVITRDKDGVIGKGKEMEETEERLTEEMRDRIAKEFREATKNNKTEAIQQPAPIIPPSVPGTSLGTNFDGQTSPGLQPTDNNMAAGPNHLIQVVNNTSGTQYRIWNKSGTVLATGILATLTGRAGSGDPIVLYDQLADRWFMAEFGPSACCSELIIAVSTTPNPTGTWKIYNYIDASFFPDYPKFSVWHNAYYAYTNDFNSAGTSFLGTSVWAFDRAAMIAGAATAGMVRQRLSLTNMIAMGSVGLEGMIPSTQNGLFVIPTSATSLSIFEVTPNFGASTITVGPLTALPVNAWASSGAIAQQTGGTLGSLSPRMMFKVSYRNNGGTESIVAAHTIANGGLAQARWYELRRVAGNWTTFQQGNVPGTDGNSRWMPGISMDGCGNIALMYDVAGVGAPAAHPSIRYTGRNAADPINTMTLPEAVIINAATNFGGFRWGDYNTTVQDYTSAGNPNNNSFWSTSQYGNQLTRIANYTITGGCAAAPNIVAGTATLTAEGCVANNAVIDPGETVTVSFCALNSGTSNTSNLVGTMQVSGGVTPISGPQNYGVLNFGGPAVCRSFTFSNTSGTCGGTITVTINWQDGATNLGSSTWTFTLGVLSTALLPNGDFETGALLPQWVTLASNPAPVVNSTSPHAGTKAAFLGNLPGPEPLGDASMYQQFVVPASGGILNFWYKPYTEDGITFDWQDVYITNTSNVILATVMHVCETGVYTLKTYNMAAFAGQTVRVQFLVHQDNFGDVTNMYVDDVSISQYSCCGAVCTITCPANITVTTGVGATTCGANVTFPAAVTTGLCGAVTYVPANGSFFPKGVTTVTATTAAGPSCTFTVTVNDGTPPTITCPANINVNNTPNFCSAVVTYPLPTVTDNCGLPGPFALTQTASQVPVAGSVACNAGGFHTLNSYFRAYNLGPLALPGPLQINTVTFGIELADANGTGTTQPVTVNVYTSAGAFPGGVRTLVGTSGVVQVADQTLSTLTVPITVPPTVAANAILVLELVTPDGRAPANNRFFIGSNASAQTGPSYIQAGDCGIATPTDLTTVGFPNMHIILNANGVITGPSPLVQIAGLPSGSTFPVGTTTNTFRATDIAGNTSTCSFNVIVTDNQAPALACPASIVRNTDAGLCTTTFAPPNPVISDNCAVTSLTWVMTGATTGASPLTGINNLGSQTFNLNAPSTGTGVTTVTYTAKDAAGNTTTCSFTVTVNDAQIPVITGQPATQFVCVGSDGAFAVTGSVPAGNPLTYQWQIWNGTAWVNLTSASATTATLSLPAVAFSQNTTCYRVILTGRCTSVTSTFACLYVNPLPTVSLLASRPLALLPGQSLTITAVVSPGGGSYQWKKNGVVIAATGSSLAGLSVDDIGSYTCTYTDLNGCKQTSAAMVVTGEPSDKLWVYPNPNLGQFQVRFFNSTTEPVTVQIFNSLGQKIYSKALITSGIAYSRIDVDMSNLSAGEYNAVVVRADGKVVGTRKFVKLKQ
jgi:Secretion system C-terminal sorting domain/HYR domain